MGFSRRAGAANSTIQGLIRPNFEPIRDFMVALVACKNEEDPIKDEGARGVIYLSDAQGQLTPKSATEYCQNSYSSKLL